LKATSSLIFFTLMGAALATASAAAMADGKIYRWVDKNGRVHYTDSPTSTSQEVAAPNVPMIGDSENPGEQRPENASDGAPPRAAPSSAKGDPNSEACKQARDNLASYQKAARIVQTDASGKETEVDDDQRIKLIERTQGEVKSLCGDS